MDKKTTLCCPKCGNIHLQMRAYFKLIGDCEYFRYYCQNCDEYIRFNEVCTVAEFEKKNTDVSLT